MIKLITTFGFSFSHIAKGFAGLESALPFVLIVAFVLCLVLYDLWDQTMRARNQTERDR